MPDIETENEIDIGEDIAGDIRAAMDTLKGETPPAETPSVEAKETAPAERDDGRDAHGRFKAKEQQAVAEPGSKPATAQGAEAAATGTTPVAPPAKWEPEAKAAFIAAPPEVQKQILARMEADEKANADWQPKAQTYAMIEQVIAPQREAWARAGVTEAQAISYLVTAQQELDRDLPSGLAGILNSYAGRQHPLEVMVGAAKALGLTRADWLAIAGVGPEEGGEGGQQQQSVQDPRYHALEQKVRSLEGTLSQAEQAKQQQVQQVYLDEIAKFAADPANLYYENVKPMMAAILKAGQAQDLPTAYRMACRADEKISTLINAQDAKAKAEADRAAIAAKKAAGGSVTGSPGPDGKAVRAIVENGAKPLNQTDEIRQAARQALAELRA